MEEHTQHLRTTAETVGMVGGVGLLFGIGQLLLSPERITWKVAIGRAITNAVLTMPAASIYLFIPEAPLAAVIGVAAALASLGVSGLEKLLERITSRC